MLIVRCENLKNPGRLFSTVTHVPLNPSAYPHDLILHITMKFTEDYVQEFYTISPKKDIKVDIFLTSGLDIIR